MRYKVKHISEGLGSIVSETVQLRHSTARAQATLSAFIILRDVRGKKRSRMADSIIPPSRYAQGKRLTMQSETEYAERSDGRGRKIHIRKLTSGPETEISSFSCK